MSKQKKSFGFTLRSKLVKVNSSGFTLIELIVAMAIVGLLAMLSLVTYSSVRQSGRDQERVRELTAIKQALEFYRNDQRNYPTTANFPAVGNVLYSPDGYRQYMEAIPADPSSGRIYRYQTIPSSCINSDSDPCSGFIICAAKERSGSFYPLTACDSLNCGSVSCSMGLSSGQ